MNGKCVCHHRSRERFILPCLAVTLFNLMAKKSDSNLQPREAQYLLMKITRKLNLAFEDLLVNGHGVIVVEGVDTSEHLVGEDAKRPPVDGLAVTLVEKYFRGQVLRCTAKRISARLTVLSEPEVRQLEVTFLINEDVLRLQVSVDDVKRVQVLEHQSNLSGVKPNEQKAEEGESLVWAK